MNSEQQGAGVYIWVMVVEIVAFVALLGLPPAARATDDEWHLQLNTVNTLSGSSCPSYPNQMDGTDAVLGTFDWTASGLTFEYSYDIFDHSNSISADEVDSINHIYFISATTNWGGSIPSSGTFWIIPSDGSASPFTCTF